MAKVIKKTLLLTDVANVLDGLNIIPVQNCQQLQDWEAATGQISPVYEGILERARQELFINRLKWNEEELKMKFISLVLQASELDVPNLIGTFYERPLAGTIQGYYFSVICDCMIATPTPSGRPKLPYFFLQEFKKGKGDRIDAEAQMLVAMLLAQQANNDNKPLYGAWLVGEQWYFAILNGVEYCLSKTLLASEPQHLNKIIYMLQYLKTLILNR